MALRRRAQPIGPIWFGNWPRARLPLLVGSDAADALEDALRRYVNGEVSGRSFLIAGHRGAGKTTLVRRVAEKVTDDILDRLINQAKATIPPDSLLSMPQRPLVVRVHGPSLLLDELPGPGAGEAPVVSAPKAADTADQPDAAAPAKPSGKQSVLVQLTISLYRALASECALAFAIHARAKGGADWPEIAADLQLALDEAPDPALLRAYWAKFDALDHGVLWPHTIGQALAQAGQAGQGLREIVAVATAAQIFEVSAGKVEFSKIKKDSNRAEHAAGGASGWAKMVQALPGFGTGAALGGGAAYGFGLGGFAGVFAALLGGAAFNWSGKLSRTREDTLDYRVTLDRSEASLERDLPLAIERIRAAGLAPVFLIDELDKLDDVEATMRNLIFRMKQLTTDYGFFCFLTDRTYFDTVQRAIERGAYPLEHSFFSERLYVLNTPEDLDRYIEQGFEPTEPAASLAAEPDQASRHIHAKLVLHRSKLNMIDAVRALDSPSDLAPEIPRTDLRYRLPATIQAAIEHVLRSPEFAIRARQDSGFRQLLIDALYIVSRAWESDERTITLEDNDIAHALLDRVNVAPGGDAKAALRHRVGERDTNLVIGAVRKLLRLLCDFAFLREELERSGGYATGLLDILTEISPPLLRRVTADPPAGIPPQLYEFQYEQFGRAIADAEGLPLDDETVSALATLMQYALEVRAAFLGMTNLRLSDLIAMELWPADLVEALLDNAVQRLTDAAQDRLGYAGLSADRMTLTRVKDSFVRNLRGLTMLLELAINLSRDTNIAVMTMVPRIQPFFDVPALLAELGDGPSVPMANRRPGTRNLVRGLPDGPTTPRPSHDELASKPIGWAAWLASCRNAARARPKQKIAWAAVWDRRADMLIRLFDFRLQAPADFANDYDDLVLAAAQTMPVSLLPLTAAAKADISAGDWSLLALEALNTSNPAQQWSQTGPAAPAWIAIPALYALGFGRPILEAASKLISAPADVETQTSSPAAINLLAQIQEAAPVETLPGVLVIVAEDTAFTTRPSPLGPNQPPVFLVRSDHLPVYDTAIQRLTDLNAFQGTIDEQRE